MPSAWMHQKPAFVCSGLFPFDGGRRGTIGSGDSVSIYILRWYTVRVLSAILTYQIHRPQLLNAYHEFYISVIYFVCVKRNPTESMFFGAVILDPTARMIYKIQDYIFPLFHKKLTTQ